MPSPRSFGISTHGKILVAKMPRVVRKLTGRALVSSSAGTHAFEIASNGRCYARPAGKGEETSPVDPQPGPCGPIPETTHGRDEDNDDPPDGRRARQP